MKIRVCCPFYSDFELLKPVLRELYFCQEHEFLIPNALVQKQTHGFRQSGVPRAARNHGINDGLSKNKLQKITTGEDAFLIIDTDVIFCLESVLRLIEHDKDVCVAPYQTHSDMREYECGMFKGVLGSKGDKFKIFEHGLKKIDWCGAGFMLVKAEVFEKIEFPWFRQNMIVSGDNQDECSEDIGFCMNLREHNVDLWCDFDISIVHAPRPAIDRNIWSGASNEELQKFQMSLSQKGK